MTHFHSTVDVVEKLETSKARIEQRAAYLIDREQNLVMEKMEANLGQDSKAELADNTWLKGQVITITCSNVSTVMTIWFLTTDCLS